MGVSDLHLARSRGVGAATLEILERGEEGFASFAIAIDSLERDVAQFQALGAPYDEPNPGERERPDGEMVRWLTALPDRVGPDGLPFLIEQPAVAAARYHAGVGLSVLPEVDGTLDLPVGPNLLRLVPPSPDDPCAAIVVAGTAGSPRSVDILGCRFLVEVATLGSEKG